MTRLTPPTSSVNGGGGGVGGVVLFLSPPTGFLFLARHTAVKESQLCSIDGDWITERL